MLLQIFVFIKWKRFVDLLYLEMTCNVVCQHVCNTDPVTFLQALDFVVPCGTGLQDPALWTGIVSGEFRKLETNN